MPRGLTLEEVDALRRGHRRSVLLFLTDRCPVGCGHCSVDSRANSPTIADWPLFTRLLDGICGLDGTELVGISGGEPFVERRGLTLAVDRLGAAGKLVLLYTSGVWAGRSVPQWVTAVLRRASSVFLSTDGYHARMLAPERFVRAAQAIREAGVPLVVQVIGTPEHLDPATELLQRAFGDGWEREAELSLTPALPFGRGANVFHRRARFAGREFGRCSALAAPVVRYDGRVTACCNEQVITGRGPEQLRSRCAGATDLQAALDRFDAEPLLTGIRSVGPGALTAHPRLQDLAGERYASICDLCWAQLERMPAVDTGNDKLLAAAALVGGTRT